MEVKIWDQSKRFRQLASVLGWYSWSYLSDCPLKRQIRKIVSCAIDTGLWVALMKMAKDIIITSTKRVIAAVFIAMFPAGTVIPISLKFHMIR
jgi:hypothetical protein